MAKGEAAYRNGLRSAVRGYWSGVLDRSQFEEAFRLTIDSRFYEAFLEGAAQCKISEEELTTEEWTALEQAITEEFGFIGPFADAIAETSKANGGKLTPLLNRVDGWVKRYNDVSNRAKVMACKNTKLLWIVNSKETCKDCLRLKNQVRRASVWQAADIRPQHPDLECMRSAGGPSVCLCDLKPTDRPASKGPLPKI